jgi:uncharacterized membrane protein YgcG
MRKYTDDEERTIRAGRLADEWMRSGLIDAAQHARLAPTLHTDLRRTNRFLRVTLFGFGLVIIAAAVGLVIVTADVNDAAPAGAICVVAAAACAAVAELLAGRFRLYRFGIEEACAVGGAVLVAAGCGLAAERLPAAGTDPQLLVALVAGATAAFALYRRFGYVYAAIAAMICAGLAPFELDVPLVVRRLLATAILTACVVAARLKHRQYGDEYPGDEYGALQAAAVLGVYAALNLQLSSPAADSFAAPFYWFTYAMIWIVPGAACLSSARERDRLLLDASLLMALATVITSKPYLGLARQAWDPILLGVLLIGTAIGLRRWFGAGDGGMRRGVTASRIFRADKDRVALAGIASGFREAPAGTHDAPPNPFAGDGGRSGGGGAAGSF